MANEMGVACVEFASGEDFLAAYTGSHPGCLVAEFRLLGISGIELQEALLADDILIPMLFLSHFADTRLTVQAMRNGAITILSKPAPCHELWDALRRALARSQEFHAIAAAHQKFRHRLAKLSHRERSVLPFILAAMSDRKIAQQLDFSQKIVRSVRQQIFKKTRCDSVAALVQLTRETNVYGRRQIDGPPGVSRNMSPLPTETLDLQREMLAHASRLTQPELVAGMVHEICQPLQAISSYSTIIDGAIRGNQPLEIDKVQRWNQMISASSKLATTIAERFGGFVSAQFVQRCDESLEAIVRESILILQFAAQSKHVTIRLDAGDVTARVDRVQIQQVLVHLLKNAIDAAVNNPTNVRLVTVKIESNVKNAQIIVSDNGRGIRESDVAELFEPFGSLTDDRLGFGLATSKQIVESHDGELWYQPNDPRGSSFHIQLPLVPLHG